MLSVSITVFLVHIKKKYLIHTYPLQMNKNQLEERLIDFAVSIIAITKQLPSMKIGNHMTGQLLRSGTSPALNYGESRSAESKKDFIHKLQVVLKELRESHVALRIIKKSNLVKEQSEINSAIEECNELISIFVKSIQTAHKNNKKPK